MFDSVVLDVAIGLIFTFLTVSLISGLLTEVYTTVLGWRANTLIAGVKALVNDPNFKGLAQALYQHALVHPRGNGAKTDEAALTKKPAYVDPLHFADAMLDTLKVVGGTADQMRQAIASSPLIKDDNQMQTMLTGMATRANGDVEALRASIANWFDAGMDRVSGSYKRWTQLYCFVFGLAIAGALNVDTFQIATAMWRQPQMTHALSASQQPADAYKQFAAMPLPIGWSGGELPATDFGWFVKFLGWSITALATLFGSTFWFDALSGVLKLRGAGPSPDEKKDRPTTASTSVATTGSGSGALPAG